MSPPASAGDWRAGRPDDTGEDTDKAAGFFVQTVALQLGAVNGVTAVLVVGETAGPSLVGVLFLGDTAKEGLGWLAVVGFIGAVIGAVLVAWYGSGDPDHFGEAPPMKGGWRRGRENDDLDTAERDAAGVTSDGSTTAAVSTDTDDEVSEDQFCDADFTLVEDDLEADLGVTGDQRVARPGGNGPRRTP